MGGVSTEDHFDNTTVPCLIFGGDKHKCDIIVATRCVMASISLIGCIFMITVIWLFRKYLFFTQRIVLAVSVAALLASLGYMANGSTTPGPFCTFIAWLVSMLDWCVLMWVWCITFNLYMNAVRMVPTEKYEIVYHVVCWGFPLLVSFLPFIGHHYGPAGMWCWIIDNWKWRFGIWYLPLFVSIFTMFFMYSYIILMVHRKAKTWEGLYDPDVERKKRLLMEDVKPLRGYPFVYLVTSVFPLINRIQNAVHPGHPIFALVLLHTLTSPLQGALNALVFGLDKETANRLTPSQIKMAFLGRLRRDSLIREYPQETEPASTIEVPGSVPEQPPGEADNMGNPVA